MKSYAKTFIRKSCTEIKLACNTSFNNKAQSTHTHTQHRNNSFSVPEKPTTILYELETFFRYATHATAAGLDVKD